MSAPPPMSVAGRLKSIEPGAFSSSEMAWMLALGSGAISAPVWSTTCTLYRAAMSDPRVQPLHGRHNAAGVHPYVDVVGATDQVVPDRSRVHPARHPAGDRGQHQLAGWEERHRLPVRDGRGIG